MYSEIECYKQKGKPVTLRVWHAKKSWSMEMSVDVGDKKRKVALLNLDSVRDLRDALDEAEAELMKVCTWGAEYRRQKAAGV